MLHSARKLYPPKREYRLSQVKRHSQSRARKSLSKGVILSRFKEASDLNSLNNLNWYRNNKATNLESQWTNPGAVSSLQPKRSQFREQTSRKLFKTYVESNKKFLPWTDMSLTASKSIGNSITRSRISQMISSYCKRFIPKHIS